MSVLRPLIAKDLYLYRWLIVATTVAGLAALFLAGAGGVPGQIGGILYVTVLVVLGVFLAIHSQLTERQSRSLLFVLSLPVSPLQYTVAKLAAGLFAFLIPWTVLLATGAGLNLAFDPPADGSLPHFVCLMAFLLANFCVLMALAVVSHSELWSIVSIIASNTAVPVFLATVLPAITRGLDGAVALWTPAVLATLGLSALVAFAAPGLALFLQSRRKDVL